MADRRLTSLSMLQGMRERDTQQWDRFAQLYGPLVYEWCRRSKVQEHDAADIVQEVFRAVTIRINEFRRERPSDSFHGWLWGITRHKVHDHFRKVAKYPSPIGGSTAQLLLQNAPENVPKIWDDQQVGEDTQALYQRALELLRVDFEPCTWQAFWQVAVDDAKASTVATDLGMTVGAVYNAKYKVLKRLREEFAELM